MDIDELLVVLSKAEEGKLQKIDDELYDKIKDRILELEEMKKEAENEEEIIRIENEILTLRSIQKRLFEARTIKIIRMAWSKVCDVEMVEGIDNMTSEERNLFENLVEILESFKRRILEIVRKREEYVLVRIKKDIPEFEGVDGKTYKLKREDVVVLPKFNAKALIDGGVAEEIEVKE